MPEIPMRFIIQASSRSWSGGRDVCMNSYQGRPAIAQLVARLFDWFPAAELVVAAPAFDQDGDLPDALSAWKNQISFVFAHDASPLLRLIDAVEQLSGDAFIRINGLNMFDTAVYFTHTGLIGYFNNYLDRLFDVSYIIKFVAMLLSGYCFNINVEHGCLK